MPKSFGQSVNHPVNSLFYVEKALLLVETGRAVWNSGESVFHTHPSGSGFHAGVNPQSSGFCFYRPAHTDDAESTGLCYRKCEEIVEGVPLLLVMAHIVPTNMNCGSYCLSCNSVENTKAVLNFRFFSPAEKIIRMDEFLWCFEKEGDGYALRAAMFPGKDAYMNMEKSGVTFGKRQKLTVKKVKDTLTVSRIIDDTLFYLRFTNTGNYQSSFELLYVESGLCSCTVGPKERTLKSRNLLLINTAAPHRFFCPSEKGCVVWSISLEPFPPGKGQISLAELIDTNPVLSDFLKGFHDVCLIQNGKPFLHAIKELCRESKKASASYLNLLANKLLLDASGMCKENPLASEYTDLAMDYMICNYHSIQSVEDIAKAVGLNKIYLERIFKQATGITVWNYLSGIRMEKAAAFLKNTDVPIGSIDELIGICSRQTFYITFKKRYGMSPFDYRKFHKDMD